MPAINDHNLFKNKSLRGTGLVPICFPLHANIMLLGGHSREKQGTKSK